MADTYQAGSYSFQTPAQLYVKPKRSPRAAADAIIATGAGKQAPKLEVRPTTAYVRPTPPDKSASSTNRRPTSAPGPANYSNLDWKASRLDRSAHKIASAARDMRQQIDPVGFRLSGGSGEYLTSAPDVWARTAYLVKGTAEARRRGYDVEPVGESAAVPGGYQPNSRPGSAAASAAAPPPNTPNESPLKRPNLRQAGMGISAVNVRQAAVPAAAMPTAAMPTAAMPGTAVPGSLMPATPVVEQNLVTSPRSSQASPRKSVSYSRQGTKGFGEELPQQLNAQMAENEQLRRENVTLRHQMEALSRALDFDRQMKDNEPVRLPHNKFDTKTYGGAWANDLLASRLLHNEQARSREALRSMKAGWAAERETLVAEVIKLEKDNELLREIIGGKMPSSMDHLWNSARRRLRALGDVADHEDASWTLDTWLESSLQEVKPLLREHAFTTLMSSAPDELKESIAGQRAIIHALGSGNTNANRRILGCFLRSEQNRLLDRVLDKLWDSVRGFTTDLDAIAPARAGSAAFLLGGGDDGSEFTEAIDKSASAAARMAVKLHRKLTKADAKDEWGQAIVRPTARIISDALGIAESAVQRLLDQPQPSSVPLVASEGNAHLYYSTLAELLGPIVDGGMLTDHTARPDSRIRFQSSCGGFVMKTFSEFEFYLVTDPTMALQVIELDEWPNGSDRTPIEYGFRPVRASDGEYFREKLDIMNARLKKEAHDRTGLSVDHVSACRLYTGPIGIKYVDAIHRPHRMSNQSNKSAYLAVKDDELCLGNRYATTIATLAQAVSLLSQLTKVAPVYYAPAAQPRLPRKVYEPEGANADAPRRVQKSQTKEIDWAAAGISGPRLKRSNTRGLTTGRVALGFGEFVFDVEAAKGRAAESGVALVFEVQQSSNVRGANLGWLGQLPSELEYNGETAIVFSPSTVCDVLGVRSEGGFSVVEMRPARVVRDT
jgi:hypothetical protein